MPGANHTEVFNCSPDEFYKIIADYEKYPEFLSEVKAIRVLKKDGKKKLVEYKVSVIKTFSYSIWTQEDEPKSISWEFAGGDIFKTMSGSWKLKDEAGKTRAVYSVDATFGVFVPGPIAKTLLTVNLPTMMSAYHKRIKDIYGK
jgi:ribosome-associated toxin RatA of RatAB toxin-antitoxin module